MDLDSFNCHWAVKSLVVEGVRTGGLTKDGLWGLPSYQNTLMPRLMTPVCFSFSGHRSSPFKKQNRASYDIAVKSIGLFPAIPIRYPCGGTKPHLLALHEYWLPNYQPGSLKPVSSVAVFVVG
jgi:hypothetical protein